jgi:hypothetical protein
MPGDTIMNSMLTPTTAAACTASRADCKAAACTTAKACTAAKAGVAARPVPPCPDASPMPAVLAERSRPRRSCYTVARRAVARCRFLQHCCPPCRFLQHCCPACCCPRPATVKWQCRRRSRTAGQTGDDRAAIAGPSAADT